MISQLSCGFDKKREIEVVLKTETGTVAPSIHLLIYILIDAIHISFSARACIDDQHAST